MSDDIEGRSFIRRGQSLVPADIHAEDVFTGLKEGGEIVLLPRRYRNPKHHRKLFALLKITVENSERYNDTTLFLHDLKVVTGLCTTHYNHLTGEVYPEPASISFASMSQVRFEEWYALALQACSEHLGTDVESLAQQVWAATEKAG